MTRVDVRELSLRSAISRQGRAIAVNVGRGARGERIHVESGVLIPKMARNIVALAEHRVLRRMAFMESPRGREVRQIASVLKEIFEGARQAESLFAILEAGASSRRG